MILPAWFELGGAVPRRFYSQLLAGGAAATFGDTLYPAHSTLDSLGDIRHGSSSGGDLENPSTTIQIRDLDSAARANILGAPGRVMALARVVGSTDPVRVELFAGVVTRLSVSGRVYSLTVQS